MGFQAIQQVGFISALLFEFSFLVFGDAFQSELDQGQVADRQFQVDCLNIAQWINTAIDVKHGRVVKSPDHVTNRVNILELVQPLLARLGIVGWGRCQQALNLGMFGLLGLVHP